MMPAPRSAAGRFGNSCRQQSCDKPGINRMTRKCVRSPAFDGDHICAQPLGLVDDIGKRKSRALSRTPSYCRASPRDKASVSFGMAGDSLSRWAFRNELFKKFQQISLDKPLVYFLDLRDTLL